jgi:hypothetical protein
MGDISRRTIFIFLSIAALAVQRKFAPHMDTAAILTALLSVGAWVLGDSIRKDTTVWGNKWLNLIREPRFQAMLAGLLTAGATAWGIALDDTEALMVASLIGTWIIGNSVRPLVPDTTPLPPKNTTPTPRPRTPRKRKPRVKPNAEA